MSGLFRLRTPSSSRLPGFCAILERAHIFASIRIRIRALTVKYACRERTHIFMSS